MEGAVLANEGIAVPADRVAGGMGLIDGRAGRLVGFGQAVCGEKHSLIHHEIIGIGGGQAFTFFVVNGRGHRHSYQPVRFALGRAESLDLLFHTLQSGIMLVGRVGAFHIKNGIIRAKAGEGVDMAIGVVTCKIKLCEPEEMVHA